MIAGVAVAGVDPRGRRVLVDVRGRRAGGGVHVGGRVEGRVVANGGGARWRRSSCLRRLERVAVWGVPSSEALVPLLVVAGLPRAAAVWSGRVGDGVLGRARRRRGAGSTDASPCGCFGGRESVELRVRPRAERAADRDLPRSSRSRGADAPAIVAAGHARGGDALPLALTLGALAAAVARGVARVACGSAGGGAHDVRDARRIGRPPAPAVRARAADRGGSDGGGVRRRRAPTGAGRRTRTTREACWTSGGCGSSRRSARRAGPSSRSRRGPRS